MAGDITIDKLVAGFGSLSADLRRGLLKDAGQAAALDIRNEARFRVVRRTSNLMRSIQEELVSASADSVEYEIGPHANYGLWVETGTGIYGPRQRPIRPVNARILRWVNAQGMEIFAREVRGMKPRPYLIPAFEAKKDHAAETAMVVIWSGVERALPS